MEVSAGSSTCGIDGLLIEVPRKDIYSESKDSYGRAYAENCTERGDVLDVDATENTKPIGVLVEFHVWKSDDKIKWQLFFVFDRVVIDKGNAKGDDRKCRCICRESTT